MWFTLGGCGGFHDCLTQQTILSLCKVLTGFYIASCIVIIYICVYQAVEDIYMYESISPGP